MGELLTLNDLLKRIEYWEDQVRNQRAGLQEAEQGLNEVKGQVLSAMSGDPEKMDLENLKKILGDESYRVRLALQFTNNDTEAAKLLNMSTRSLYRKKKEHGL